MSLDKKQKTVLICGFFLSVVNTTFLPLLLFLVIKESSAPLRGAVWVKFQFSEKLMCFWDNSWTSDLDSTFIYPLGGRAEPTGSLNCVRKKEFLRKREVGLSTKCTISLIFINISTVQFSPHRKTSHYLSPPYRPWLWRGTGYKLQNSRRNSSLKPNPDKKQY